MQIHTSSIDGTREARSKRYHQHHKAAQSAEDQTANGPAKAHHHNHGKTATEDTAAPKIAVHQASTEAKEEATTAATNTDPRLHHQVVTADRTGETAQIEATMVSHHLPQTADTPSLLSLATAPMAQTAGDNRQLPPAATHTYPATAQKAPAVPANQTIDLAAARAIRVTHEKDTQMTAPTATARIEIDPIGMTREVSRGNDEMDGHDRAVQTAGIKDAITGITEITEKETQISTVDDRSATVAITGRRTTGSMPLVPVLAQGSNRRSMSGVVHGSLRASLSRCACVRGGVWRLNLWFIRMKSGWLPRWAWAFLVDWFEHFPGVYDFLVGGGALLNRLWA